MTQPWSVCQYRTPLDTPGEARVGILAGDIIYAAPPALSDRPMTRVIDDWVTSAAVLRRLEVVALPPVVDATLVAPLTYPRKVLCAGANYFSHTDEMKTQRPDPHGEPFFFLKPPTTCVVGPHDDVAVPSGKSDVDWEAELAVVVAARARDVSEADALSLVAGYTVANDLSARGLFPRSDGGVSPAFAFDWLKHKGQDGFCPIGPGIVPVWQVPDPQALTLRLWVNGELKQDASTADMVVPVARLIAAASRIVTLEPGDIILTGTPAGVGMPKGTFLHAGDVVSTEIEGIGRLTNRMIAP